MAESLESPYFTVTLQSYKAGSTFYAKPTHFLDPRNFYVLPLAHQNIVYEIQRPGGKYQQEDLKINKIVIFFSQSLHGYVRGTIEHITEDGKCNIYAMDNGFIEKNVDVERIFHPVHDTALHIPGLARHCELDEEFGEETPEAFRYFEGNEKLYLRVLDMTGEKMHVTLFDGNPEEMVTLLSLAHYRSEPPPNSSLNEPSQTYDWKHHELEEGQTLHVRVQHGSYMTGFYVCTQGDYRDYLKNRAKFTSYCRSQPQIPFNDFVRGKPIGVMEYIDEPYERAVITEIVAEGYKAKVKLIDWGREFVTEIDKVKLNRSEVFAATPARALYCSAPTSKAWNNGLPTFLYKGFALAITVDRVGREFDIPHIVTLSPAGSAHLKY